MNKKLFLIDGHALIFKMYYAFLRHPMINSKGTDTSILFGFTKCLLELIEKEKPTHLAVAFDPPGGTFRHQIYPDYKGTRPQTPQLVIDALEPLTEICRALRIPVLMVPGFEADDVIGSMAKTAEKEGFEVYMVTPDKDYGQLVSDRIFQYKPGKSGEDSEVIGPAEICAKYGISSPAQVIDMLTICGDSADNVPGVKGVGEVGAGKLIAAYGSVENIYQHLDELTPKQRNAFEAARDHIALSHELVTIKTDIETGADTADMAIDFEYDHSIADIFDRYEFNSLKKHIGDIGTRPQESTKKFTLDISAIEPSEAIALALKQGRCAIVTDGSSEGIFAEISGVTIAIATSKGNFASYGSAEDFRSIIEDETVSKTGYDLKKQYCLLNNNGICLKGKLYDIELMHYLVNPEKSHKIDILAKSYLDTDYDADVPASVPLSLFEDAEPESCEAFRTKEAAISFLLCEKILAELRSISLESLYCDLEEPLIRVLAKMEYTGVKIDFAQLRKYATSLAAELEQRQQRIREMAGEPDLNILSTKQIGYVIFEKLSLDPKVKAKTGTRYSYSTDEETLTSLAGKHPIINEILEFRGVKKLLSTYIEPFPNYASLRTGKIHTTFNQALTATGRLSSSRPNLQNIPIRTERGKEIRKAFIPSSPDGLILSADYSQIELRIMAHLSGDSHLTEAFRENRDIHSITAAKIFNISLEEVTQEQRRIAKTANFGIIYGISSFGLAQRLKIPRAASKRIIDDYFANFPAVSSYIERTVAAARECGYVETLFGRRRYLPDINSRNSVVRSLAERNAINAPIQGTSADIIKKAMTKIDERITEARLKSRMVLQIHDELVFDAVSQEIETLKNIVVEEMENVIKISVPLTVECNYGKNWLEAH